MQDRAEDICKPGKVARTSSMPGQEMGTFAKDCARMGADVGD
jgi:hypothetical protein